MYYTQKILPACCIIHFYTGLLYHMARVTMWPCIILVWFWSIHYKMEENDQVSHSQHWCDQKGFDEDGDFAMNHTWQLIQVRFGRFHPFGWFGWFRCVACSTLEQTPYVFAKLTINVLQWNMENIWSMEHCRKIAGTFSMSSWTTLLAHFTYLLGSLSLFFGCFHNVLTVVVSGPLYKNGWWRQHDILQNMW